MLKDFKLLLGLSAVLVMSITSCSKKNEPTRPAVKPPVEQPAKVYGFESTAAWFDEFDTNGAPDPLKWTYDTGGNGWGNNELQYYTNASDNVVVSNGVLTITAKKETRNGMAYTSARVVSKNNSDMLYGRYEIKAKLPAGRGTWPAIWMLPNNNDYGVWPNSGEIDIMEHVGYDPNNVHFSLHNQLYFGEHPKTSVTNIATATNEFHLYRTDWTPAAVKGYYDDTLVFTYLNDGKGPAGWPYDKPFHLLLNIAIGGNWGGAMGIDDTVFPAAMQVDYVRFYKMTTN